MCATRSCRKSVYVCPQPTNRIGWPVTYVIESAAPTFKHEKIINILFLLSERKPIKYLIVNRIPLGDQHAINATTLTRRSGKVLQRAVEFGKLIDGFITHESFADKDDLIRIVCRNELRPKSGKSDQERETDMLRFMPYLG